MTHAPTPWVFSPWHIEEGAPAVRQGTINGYIIATTDTDDNAAFIVRAVNCHDDLVEALNVLLRCSNAIVGASLSDDSASDAFGMYNDARLQARRALNTPAVRGGEA